MAFSKAQAYLKTFHNYEIQKNSRKKSFDLNRVKILLAALGDPQKEFFAFHVAGTKGKGSTCAFTASLLKEQGYRVGLYTSPHLVHVTERIRILEPLASYAKDQNFLEGQISQKSFSRLLEEIRPAVERTKREIKGEELTLFEVLTSACFYYFAKKKIRVAVIETGLGGRLDATNTLDRKICGITSLGLEHVEQLGPGLKNIAREKAGIINEKAEGVVVAPQIRGIHKILEKQAEQFGLRISRIGREILYTLVHQSKTKQIFNIQTRKNYFQKLCTYLLGEHQVVNAALAIGMVEHFFEIRKKHVFDSCIVHKGIQNAFWPGRFEVVQQKPVVLLDCAHSAQSAKALAETYQKVFQKQKAIVVLGVSKDKNRKGICKNLEKIAKEFILTRSEHPRSHAFSLQEISTLFVKCPARIINSAQQAFQAAVQQAKKNDVIVVTGSVFLVGEIRKNASR